SLFGVQPHECEFLGRQAAVKIDAESLEQLPSAIQALKPVANRPLRHEFIRTLGEALANEEAIQRLQVSLECGDHILVRIPQEPVRQLFLAGFTYLSRELALTTNELNLPREVHVNVSGAAVRAEERD